MFQLIPIPPTPGNASPAVRQALAAIQPGRQNILLLENAVYTFDREGTFCETMQGVNLLESEKHFLFRLENLSDLVIDGGGALLQCRDRLFPFFFRNCRNVTLRNFTLDFTFSRYCHGEVIFSDEQCFRLRFDPGLFCVTTDAAHHVEFHCCREVYSTADQVILAANSDWGKAPWDFLFAGDSTAEKQGLATTFLETDAYDLGGGVIEFRFRPGTRRPVYPLGDRILFIYEPRDINNIRFENCRNVTVENVTMYRAGGMGLVAVNTENITVEGLRVGVRPGRAELRSSTADALYFVQCSGAVTVRGCDIRDTADDALNIHNIYTVVTEAADARRVSVAAANPEHTGLCPYVPGDCITVSDGATHREKGRGVVETARLTPDGGCLLTLREPLAVQRGDIVDNQSHTADFLLEDCHFENCPHVRVSGGGRLALRRNVFDRMHGLLFLDLLEYWYESGAVRELCVEENRIENTPCHGDGFAVTIASTRRPTTDVRLQNVQFIRNVWQGCRADRAVSLSDTDGALFGDNTVDGQPLCIAPVRCTGVTVL